MGQFEPKSFAQILERMINRVVARTTLTDINDGSVLKQILAAAAREDDDAFYQMINLLDLFDIDKAIGNDLDERAKEFNPSIISRNLAVKASGTAVFSRTGTSGAVTISVGTRITVPATGSQPEVVYSTTSEGTIADTFQDSGSVTIVADTAGTEGNATSGSIVGFISKPSGVDSVLNLVSLTNGEDTELDSAFRKRLKNSIKGLARAHVDGLETAVLLAEDTTLGTSVRFAQVVESTSNLGNVIIYIDDGSGTVETNVVVTGQSVLAAAIGGETTVFLPHKPIKTAAAFNLYRNAGLLVENTDYILNAASSQIDFLPTNFPTGLTTADAITSDYTYYTGLIAEAQKIVDGDSADRSNYPGYRASGVLVRVLPPLISYQTSTANVTVLAGFSQVDVLADVASEINTYINGLGIGEDVVLNELRRRTMALAGVYDIEFAAPTDNTVILDTQIARILSTAITIT